MQINTSLRKFEETPPEIIFEWKDPETDACGWMVINSLRGGAAGGGTRIRKGLTCDEVISLAKTMEIKFTISGPQIGGAKSGINFDPEDPRKMDVLRRWYKAVSPMLKEYYGTGGDLNIDEAVEVIPITESMGLWHPQEGIINGHFQPSQPDKIKKIGQLRAGVSKIIENPDYYPESKKKYLVADMITGFGVAEAVRHTYEGYGGSLEHKRVIIQGWGNVGATAACYMANLGARIVGIIDRNGGLINEDGFELETIKNMFFNKNRNELISSDLIEYDEINQQVWNVGAEIFLPCAASRLVTMDQVETMISGGLELISCGANVPFSDNEIFYGPIAQYADQHVTVIPDFIANCGMARVFAYLMQANAVLTDKAIFEDVSAVIKNAVERIVQSCPAKIGMIAKAYEISLSEL